MLMSTIRGSHNGLSGVVIIGGAGLIGWDISRAAGTSGFIPILVDNHAQRLEAAVDALHREGIDAIGCNIDVARRELVEQLCEEVVTSPLEVSSVVVAAYPRFVGTGSEDRGISFRQELASHVGIYYDLNEVFGHLFATASGGSIVNLSSIYGAHAPRFETYIGTSMTVPPHYAASKAAIDALTRYFAALYLKDGVRFNALAPGGLAADQPQEFVDRYEGMCGTIGLLDPKHVSGLAVFLLSEAASAITGQVITIDDGWSLS